MGRGDRPRPSAAKGGWAAGGAVATELVDELAEGVVVVAEASGGILLGQAAEEDGAERLILPLGGAGRLIEEELAGGVVHARGSECEVFRDEIRGLP